MMTDEEFEANLASTEIEAHRVNELMDSTLSNDALVLCREIRRLRGLIKHQEWVGSCCYDAFCPWCGDERSYKQDKHTPTCPAFTPDGQVR